MIKDWPTLSTKTGNKAKELLSNLCDQIEKKNISTGEIIDSLIYILSNAEKKQENDTLSDRKKDLFLLTEIVQSIYSYFHSPVFYYKIKPEVFKNTKSFWSHSKY